MENKNNVPLLDARKFPEKFEQTKLDLQKNSRQIVKYENTLNDNHIFQALGGLAATQSDIFMAMVAQFWEKNSDIIVFSSNDLRKMIGYNHSISEEQFAQLIKSTFVELQKIILEVREIQEDNHPHTVTYNLLQIADINEDTFEVRVQVAPAFVHIFNNFSKATHFTRFSLFQYLKLQSKYSKNLFRLLKEKRTLGKREFTPKELKEYLHIPKSYGPSNINERILNRAYVELSPYFERFTITKEYTRSHRISKYIFSWTKESRRRIDIYKDQSISDTIAMYNINSNPNMTTEQKDEATDKYFNLSKGTTKNNRKEKNSYFNALINNAPQNQAVKESCAKWTKDQLKFMIAIYEKLDKSQVLEVKDKQILNALNAELEKRNKPKGPEPKENELDLRGIKLRTSDWNYKYQQDETGFSYTFLAYTDKLLPLEAYSFDEVKEIFRRYSDLMMRGKASVKVLNDISTITAYLAKDDK